MVPHQNKPSYPRLTVGGLARRWWPAAAWAAFSFALGAWTRPLLGWQVFGCGLLLAVLAGGLRLARVACWAQDTEAPLPVSIGPWDDTLAPVYRKLRKNAIEMNHMQQQIDQIMLAAQALPDGAVALNDAMQITWSNRTACEHLGLDPERDKHSSIFHILRSPEFAAYARQQSWPAAQLLHHQSGGHDKSLQVQMALYGVGQFLVVTRDVTQVEKLETTRKDFVANVSHELRTPLTVLSGFLETLREMPEGALSDEQKAQYLKLMYEQARRMEAIVNDLLTLSTLESSPAAEGTPVRVALLVHNALQQARALSNGEHVFVENVDDKLGLRGTETELASAISNLLTNAVRYTPKGGTITASWYAAEDGRACYSVRDTGIGIAQEDIPRLTERFYRVDRGRSRGTGGTGLGLAITKHIAMRHQAEFSIRSRHGEGSLFSLHFPAARALRQLPETAA
jgi:two-component system phosphate regulon sensor histidine kinase PhoR